jgi:hypothetical protein
MLHQICHPKRLLQNTPIRTRGVLHATERRHQRFQKLKSDAKVLAKKQALRAEKEAKIKERRDKEERKKNSISAFFAGKSKASKEEDEEADYEDLEEVHTLQVTGKRLEAQRRESDALYYSMSGAAIFFKRSDVDT